MPVRFFLAVFGALAAFSSARAASRKPDIFFFYADDWARIASCYADPQRPSLSDAIKTPNIDRVSREGVRFDNAFYSCPQCKPSRGAIISGGYFWRTGSSAFLSGGDWGPGTPDPFDALPKFPELLARAAGYHVDRQHKTLAFTPTRGSGAGAKFRIGEFLRYGLHVSAAKTAGERKRRHDEVVEQTRATIRRVLAEAGEKPFFFVFGPTNTHRPYVRGSGQALWGLQPDALRGKVPPFLPDVPEVREDLTDALGEVLALDLMLGVFLDELQQAGRLENTLVVVTGDNGLPGVPHGKTQLYDLGSAAPLVMRWPGKIRPGRTVADFVTLMDLAPTFLEAAGVKRPEAMDARSLMPQLLAAQSGVIDPSRNHAIFGRERHVVVSRPGNLPYPSRAVRTSDFLYIRNFKPDRWPLGDPFGISGTATPAFDELHDSTYTTFRDLDGSLTKAWLVTHRHEPAVQPLYELAFAKRPTEELYDLRLDPHQIRNVAADPAYASAKRELGERLLRVMRETKDPRLDDAFDRPPYVEANAEAAGPRARKKKFAEP